jgi:hypothetical protein
MIKTRLNLWSTDKIVACGLVIMGIIAVGGTIAHQIMSGTATGSEVPMAIVSGLTGFLGRGALSSDTKVKEVPSNKNIEREEIPPAEEGLIPVKEEGKNAGVKNKVKSDISSK